MEINLGARVKRGAVGAGGGGGEALDTQRYPNYAIYYFINAVSHCAHTFGFIYVYVDDDDDDNGYDGEGGGGGDNKRFAMKWRLVYVFAP